jgi:cysteine desulfurase
VRERRAAGQQIYFHSDGVQAFGKIAVMLGGIDLYSATAHKIFGPKGVGALFVASGTPLKGIQFGGRHERERRAGTENIPGAVAFARAVELCDLHDTRVREMRDGFEKQIMDALPDVHVNGHALPRLPNTSSMTFEGASGEGTVIALDLLGMPVSSGSACSSGSTEPSHVLLGIGLSREEARSSVRFSFGRYNTENEVDALADAVIETVPRLRKNAAKEAHVVQSR